MTVDVQLSDIELLVRTFVKSSYRPREENGSQQGFNPVQKCTALMKCDYNVIEIPNLAGELCSHYPSRLIIPESELRPETNDNFGDQLGAQARAYNLQKLKETIPKARYARCRSRFPVPVLLYKGKLISRAATISGSPEIYGRSSLDYLLYGYPTETTTDDVDAQEAKEALIADAMQEEPETESLPRSASNDWQLCDRVRQQDIRLLKSLDVETIIDFMVEKKKVKFGVNVTSSEKVDKERRYDVFKIVSLPYPGCEFFRVFRDNNFNGEGLIFDWNQSYVDASIHVPEDPIIVQLPIEWDQYKLWDLVTITQNYLKLVLKYIQDGNSGMLIHCISGWDRTPLFVSLVRLSLWADGLIHQSLNPLQMLYFTIAYDWYLFGHKLPDRLKKGEDIFFFCFYFLKYIAHSDYSLLDDRAKSKASSGGSITVLWSDGDARLDNMLETESRGSTFSLNSISSFKSNNEESLNGNSHGQWTTVSLDGSTVQMGSPPHSPNNSNASNRDSAYSPPYKSRTSPVSVPVSNLMQRQHHESSSSASVGSWQMISGTGSVRSVGSDFSGANNPNANHQDSSATAKIYGMPLVNDVTRMRAEKFEKIRQTFNTYYCTEVPHFKNGQYGKGMIEKVIDTIC
ncbi:myotubularin-related protein 14 [Phlebotomus papatasi]|uniref:myotubularin-related protein 14 n=1 Tax=Phlebotomus papatasi TaxID=29031 RepID=UPI0024835164|nr:myotubularin-related protein 14 [Phlebotomus papatasi]